MEVITAFIIGLTALVTAMVSFIASLMKAKKELANSIPRKLRKQSSINLEIMTKMEELKEKLHADRVQVYDFHNGGHYANGRSALKMSCTYEVIRAGVKPIQNELQCIPINCLPSFVNTLLKNNDLEVKDLEDIKTKMPSAYDIKMHQGIKSFYDIIINNKYNEPIGFIAIQYTGKIKPSYNINEKNEILKLKFFLEENLEKMIDERR